MQVMELVEKDIRPSDDPDAPRPSKTRSPWIMAFGGSTNTSLHLPAIAKEAGVPLTLETFNAFSDKTPHLCFMSPGGPHDLADLHQAGGIPALMQELSRGGMIQTEAMTVTGKTVGENLAGRKVLDPEVIRPLEKPYHATGGLAVLFGNLAPEGAVVKRSAVDDDDAPAHRPGPRLRLGRAGHEGDHGREDQQGGRRRHPLRRAEGRPGHAGDALADLRHRRHRPGPGRRAPHRRPLLGRQPRRGDRPHLAGGGGRRPHRRRPGRRPDRDRHPGKEAESPHLRQRK